MIRTHFTGMPTRRLAVVDMSRPQRARLGSIGNGDPAMSRDGAVAWTTVSDEAPESSANFIASTISAQNAAATTTPGTLTWTPANTTPAQNVAPWNSWTQPNCLPAGLTPPSTPSAQASATQSPMSKWLLFAGVIGGIASLKAILSSGR
jgi:hypothetical protein